MDWKINMISFFAVITAICTIPFINIENDNGNVTEPTSTTCVVTVQTNDVSSITNAVDRANPVDVNWFKENSDYIWDGWKIK